jgi:hypothetical protein
MAFNTHWQSQFFCEICIVYKLVYNTAVFLVLSKSHTNGDWSHGTEIVDSQRVLGGSGKAVSDGH